MMDMTRKDEDKKSYIVGLMKLEDGIAIQYADGSMEKENFYSENNMEFYRRRMEKQAKKYVGPYLDHLKCEVLKIYVKEIIAMVIGVFGIYLLYNVDIHSIMKIILGICIAILEGIYCLYQEINLNFLVDEVREGLATEYYINHKNDFSYYDEAKKEYIDALKIDDIAKYKLSFYSIMEFEQYLETLKKENMEGLTDVKLIFNKKN